MSEFACATAREFIRELTDEKYRIGQLRWLFRGVTDASYPLLPTSHRRDKYCPFDPVPASTREQVSQEHRALLRFYEAAHREGLPIPSWHDTTQWLRSVDEALKNHREGSLVRWLNPIAADFVAIAQHYGTPTRLLDWTRDPLVAAYFAVSDLKPDQSLDNHRVAVWALDTDVEVREMGTVTPLREAHATRIVEIPYDMNQNARAQRGVFIDYIQNTVSPWVGNTEPVLCLPLDEHLGTFPINNALHKLTLPSSEAKALMRELHLSRIDGASLFPGYVGAVRAERERRWWEP